MNFELLIPRTMGNNVISKASLQLSLKMQDCSYSIFVNDYLSYNFDLLIFTFHEFSHILSAINFSYKFNVFLNFVSLVRIGRRLYCHEKDSL